LRSRSRPVLGHIWLMRAGRLRRPACIMAPGRQESDHMTFVPIKVSLAACEADAGDGP
jgi:hypothetical protein